MILAAGAIFPALLAFIGFLLILGHNSLGILLMFAGGLLGSFEACVVAFMTPGLSRILEAKLKKRDILLVWMENGRIVPLIGRFESGWIWLRNKLGYIIGSDHDRAFLDGIPTFMVYRPVGKTLNPKVMADISLLERYGISYEDVVASVKKYRRFPRIDVDDEGNLVEVVQEVKKIEEKTEPRESFSGSETGS